MFADRVNYCSMSFLSSSNLSGRRVRFRAGFFPLIAILPLVFFGYSPFAQGQVKDLFSDQEVVDPFAPSGLPPVKENPVPEVINNDTIVFQRPEDKDPSTLTEEEFYKSITATERAALTPNPVTGPDFLVAGATIARIGRPYFARILLEKGLAAEGTPAEYAAALDRLGTERILGLVNHPILSDIGNQIATKALESAAEYWRSPEFLTDALRRSEIGTLEDRTRGLLDLRKGGTDAIVLILNELAGETGTRASFLLETLRFFGPDAIRVLMLYLDGADEAKQDLALQTLGEMTSTEVGEELLIKYYDGTCSDSLRNGPLTDALHHQWGETIPAREEANRLVKERALSFYNRTATPPTLADGECTLPVWNTESQTVTTITLPPTGYYRREAARWSQVWQNVAAVLSAEAAGEASAHAVVAVAEELYMNNLDQPIDTTSFAAVFPDATPELLKNALCLALSSGHEKGGIYPVVLLGQTLDETLVQGQGGTPSILVQAMFCSDRRLRFAALQTLARIKPRSGFTGSSRVLDSLTFFLHSSGTKKAILASPKLDEALKAGNWFADLGYTVIPATTGNDVLRLAHLDADVELIVLADGIRSPDPATIIQTLKSDYRTGDIPVLFGADTEEAMPNSFDQVETEPNALWSFLPFSQESAKWSLDRLTEKTNPCPVPAELRLAQAKGIAQLLTVLRKERPGVFEPEDIENMARILIMSPVLSDQGLALAQTIPSAGVQNLLAGLLGDSRVPLARRQVILAAFRQHMATYGSLLRGPDITRLYDRYNASEKEDADTQKLLSDMLDAYEQAIGKRS